jgi:hypothetical protein
MSASLPSTSGTPTQFRADRVSTCGMSSSATVRPRRDQRGSASSHAAHAACPAVAAASWAVWHRALGPEAEGAVAEGDRMLLDHYGTDTDPQLHARPEALTGEPATAARCAAAAVRQVST